jgi:hypothetical protein
MDRRTFIKALPALTVLADAVPSLAQEPANPTTTLQPITSTNPGNAYRRSRKRGCKRSRQSRQKGQCRIRSPNASSLRSAS